MTSTTDSFWGLPDPNRDADFYADIPSKRLVAWFVDIVLIALITLLVLPLTLFIGLFFLGFLFLAISFLYRWSALARHSATPGMRFVAIELRDRTGQRFDTATAFLHTLGYALSIGIFPFQLISIVLMLMTPRRQGLTDHILGTAAINRAAA
jgi:uncharacterized RDD family membrane protein YckC